MKAGPKSNSKKPLRSMTCLAIGYTDLSLVIPWPTGRISWRNPSRILPLEQTALEHTHQWLPFNRTQEPSSISPDRNNKKIAIPHATGNSTSQIELENMLYVLKMKNPPNATRQSIRPRIKVVADLFTLLGEKPPTTYASSMRKEPVTWIWPHLKKLLENSSRASSSQIKTLLKNKEPRQTSLKDLT